ncbi:hypothetical protein [Candidatus Palauibacter sp.]|uniref:hypothetical protein n=1 Tax=Candidatus Palauibacter sp. TaxID=3101350 RepID=UPI003AF304D5
MIDIREPKDPRFIGCFAEEGTGRTGTGYTHDAQCVNYHGPRHGARRQGDLLRRQREPCRDADVTDPANPVSLASATYAAAAYTHQGWLTEDQRYFYQNDELDEMASVGAAQQAGTDPDMEASRTGITYLSALAPRGRALYFHNTG